MTFINGYRYLDGETACYILAGTSITKLKYKDVPQSVWDKAFNEIKETKGKSLKPIEWLDQYRDGEPIDMSRQYITGAE